jgi:hypothetical protein
MYLPFFLAPLKREAARLHAEELDFFRSQQADVRKRLANHDPTAADTFTAKFLNGDPASYNLSEDGAAYIIGTLFEAGGRHYRCGSNVVLLAMTLHPDAFTKLQAELDTVVGPDRPPRIRGDCQRDAALASSNCRRCTASARQGRCV